MSQRQSEKARVPTLHDSAASIQLLQYPRQHLLRQLLQLIFLAILLITILVTTLLTTWIAALVSSMLTSLLISTPMLTAMLPTLLITTMLPSMLPTMLPQRRHNRRSPLQIDIHPPLILLRRILQPQLATNLLHLRLNLLNMINTMVPLPHNHMQMILSLLLRISDPLLQYPFCFFYELPVEINGVVCDAAGRVVFAEYVVGGLVVVGVHFGGVRFAFF